MIHSNCSRIRLDFIAFFLLIFLQNLNFKIMKSLSFKSFLFLALAISVVFFSCGKEELEDTLKTEVIQEFEVVSDINVEAETELEGRAPKILVESIEPAACCSWNKRRVTIDLEDLTYSFFCGGGDVLYYKFYRTNNPCAAPLSYSSNLPAPTFCLPTGNWTLFICASNNNCALDCSGGSLNIPIGVPTSGPMYNFSLTNCLGTPILQTHR